MRHVVVTACLLFALGCTRKEDNGGEPLQSPAKAEFDKLIKENRVVLVDFQAEWCGPCREMKPTIRALERDYRGRALVIEVDVDQRPELANAFSVRSIPRILVFRDATVVDSFLGVVERDALEASLNRALGEP